MRENRSYGGWEGPILFPTSILQRLSRLVFLEQAFGPTLARLDTLLGTDSHTPMVGLGVLGRGVGGIADCAPMLGCRAFLTAPRVGSGLSTRPNLG
jgi:aconitase A